MTPLEVSKMTGDATGAAGQGKSGNSVHLLVASYSFPIDCEAVHYLMARPGQV